MFDPKKMPKNELLALLKKSDHQYHNKGKAIDLSDGEYDYARDVFASRFPAHPYNEQVGAPVKGGVKTPYPIGSLKKAKPSSKALESFIEKGPFSISDKLDGITTVITYTKKGTPAFTYTRGNGNKSLRSSAKAQIMRIPKKISKQLDVRGEVILPSSSFSGIKDSKENSYTTERGVAAGVMNRKTNSPLLKKLHFVAFRILNKPYCNMPLDKQLKILKAEGFSVVPHRTVKSITQEQLSAYHDLRINKTKYEIDGIVVEKLGANPPVGGKPSYAVAFKENSDADMVKVKVTRVEWRTSRTGDIVPRIHIDPTVIGGVSVRHFTGRNYQFIQRGLNKGQKGKIRPINKGAILLAVRSGKVIPHIEKVVKGAKTPSKPDIPFKLVGVHAKAKKENSKGQVNQIVHFFDKLGVEGFKSATVKKLVDVGHVTVFDVMELDEDDFLESGIGPSASNAIYNQISRLKPNMLDLAVASGSFSNMGRTRLDAIFEAFPQIYVLYKKSGEEAVFNRVMTLPKFQEKTAQAFVGGLADFEEYVTRFKPAQPKKKKQVKGKLTGKVFCFSGFRDAAIKKAIEDKGGVVKDTVQTVTTHLIIKDESATGSKIDKAEDMGIKIMTKAKITKALKL